jgi:PleD family two-component response regulator
MVAETAIRSADGKAITLSISAGAAFAKPGVTAEELICQADELMYRIKASRRNRT